MCKTVSNTSGLYLCNILFARRPNLSWQCSAGVPTQTRPRPPTLVGRPPPSHQLQRFMRRRSTACGTLFLEYHRLPDRRNSCHGFHGQLAVAEVRRRSRPGTATCQSFWLRFGCPLEARCGGRFRSGERLSLDVLTYLFAFSGMLSLGTTASTSCLQPRLSS